MSFRPAIPLSGYAGMKFLDRTAPRQIEAFASQASIKREAAYFRAHIADAKDAAALVADRRLLAVALGAFGLAEEIDKRALIRRVLEDGSEGADALANRMTDGRWRAFAAAFGYGDGARVGAPEFADRIIADYVERSFESAVGDVDGDLRLAMNFRREVGAVARSPDAARSGWLKILGQRPLRSVIEQALSLPSSLAGLDLNRQVAMISERSRQVFGSSSPEIFAEPEIVEDALRRFFARAALDAAPPASTKGAAALALLAPSGPGAINAILANAIGR